MPAGIYEHDSMFSVREKPWHGLGVILDKYPKNIDEAIEYAGLDWQVIQRPVYALVEGGEDRPDDPMIVEPVEGYFVNVRTDTNQPLGIVTSRYQPVQNREAFSFLANIFGSDMHFETAGSLMNGRRVWVLMKLPEWVEIGGDAVVPYAFISNSHDGKSSVLLSCTPIRIVCENTLGAAVRMAKGGNAQRSYTIRHLGNMTQKIHEARNALEVTINYYEQFKQIGDKLALAKVGDKRAKTFVEGLLPIEDGMGERAARNREEARLAVLHLFREGTIVATNDVTVSTVGNAPGTAWALYNAATEYADWYRSERKEGGRFQRSIDDPDGFKTKAWELSLAAANLS